MTTITEAILSLRPNANFYIVGGTYAGVQWDDAAQAKPTEAEVLAEIARIDANVANNEYRALRAAEYPPMADYLDAVVKGDQQQIDKYIADCLAVKAKYPKPQQ